MTNEQRKEELIKRYNEIIRDDDSFSWSKLFNFFWVEIEAREKEIKDLEASEDELCTKVRKEQDEAVRVYNQGEERDKIRLAEIQRLEEIINAADLMVYEIGSNGNMGYYEALEHYNKLKSKT